VPPPRPTNSSWARQTTLIRRGHGSLAYIGQTPSSQRLANGRLPQLSSVVLAVDSRHVVSLAGHKKDIKTMTPNATQCQYFVLTSNKEWVLAPNVSRFKRSYDVNYLSKRFMNECLEIVAQTFRDAEFAYPPTPTGRTRRCIFVSQFCVVPDTGRVRHQPQNSSGCYPTGRLFSEADKSLDRRAGHRHGANFGQNLRDLRSHNPSLKPSEQTR